VSQNDLAIRIQDLGKSYTIVHGALRRATFGDAVMQRLRRPFQRTASETFWALKDISLDIKKGEVVGIIGRNGAGKSTLLKILSRITEPTAGRIEVYGRVGSLLEVGTGFHPELSGRENIYLNGAILGMSRGEIRKQFDAIVDFAEVEKFLDTPVKRYSSGMYVRLAFAVAAHLNPEILVVDEVLAVGDAEFQKKCLGKMGEVAKGGRTVLFVSHNMGAVRQLCRSGILIERGMLARVGEATEVANAYIAGLAQDNASIGLDRDRRGSRHVCFARIAVSAEGTPGSTVYSGENLLIDLGVESDIAGARFAIGIQIANSEGAPVIYSFDQNKTFQTNSEKTVAVKMILPQLALAPGDYYVHVWAGLPNAGTYDHIRFASRFHVLQGPRIPMTSAWLPEYGAVFWTSRFDDDQSGPVLPDCTKR